MHSQLMESSETVNSKFQQEVYRTIRTISGTQEHYNCQEYGIEKDVVITGFGGKAAEKHLVVEVNGVFHYPRNSEECLGKDVMKTKALERCGYLSIMLPYYNWTLLEQT